MPIPRPRIVAATAMALPIVLSGCAGSGEQAASTASSPTSSSATAAPTGTTATTRPSVTAPRTTPRPTSGSSAPWTPPTITAGTALPGEDLTPAQAAALQQSVDEGHQPWRVHADMVADSYVRNRFGWEDARVAMADPHTAEITNRPDGHMVTLQLRQPVREGPTGIWVVSSGVYLS